VATVRHSLKTAVPFSDGQFQRISETGQLCNLNFQLMHLLAREFSHLLAWSPTRISHAQNCGEFS
jgi:hypothetical protein